MNYLNFILDQEQIKEIQDTFSENFKWSVNKIVQNGKCIRFMK